jgi:hypothetical protein
MRGYGSRGNDSGGSIRPTTTPRRIETRSPVYKPQMSSMDYAVSQGKGMQAKFLQDFLNSPGRNPAYDALQQRMALLRRMMGG